MLTNIYKQYFFESNWDKAPLEKSPQLLES